MDEFWRRTMVALRFAVRVPLALLAIAAVAFGGFIGFMLLYRGTQFLWTRFLDKPWSW